VPEYWLAGQLGKAWLWARPGLCDRLGGMPAACQSIARGEPTPAEQIWRAQEFAVRVWWRFAVVIAIPSFLVIGVAAIVKPGPDGRDWAAAILGALGTLMIVGLGEAAVLRYRADQTQRYLLAGGAEARDKPLPAHTTGHPRRYDFWLMLSLVLLVCAILFYASTRSPHPGLTPFGH
jgi:hypothetical protein